MNKTRDINDLSFLERETLAFALHHFKMTCNEEIAELLLRNPERFKGTIKRTRQLIKGCNSLLKRLPGASLYSYAEKQQAASALLICRKAGKQKMKDSLTVTFSEKQMQRLCYLAEQNSMPVEELVHAWINDTIEDEASNERSGEHRIGTDGMHHNKFCVNCYEDADDLPLKCSRKNRQ